MIKCSQISCSLLLLMALSGSHAAVLPDPTRPPDYTAGIQVIREPEPEDVEFRLTAIRIDPDRRSAIVNGRLLREGDTVDTARLLEIHPAHVVLEYENERLEVRLFRNLSRTRSEKSESIRISN